MTLHLSVVIPAYNEEQRIGESIRSVVSYLQQQDFQSEIIVVDDGSSDDTVRVSKSILGDFPGQVIALEENQGKGKAVKTGMLTAKGNYILFTDADLSTPITEIKGFFEVFDQGVDIVIGSRALQDSNITKKQPILRQWMGRIYNLCATLLVFKGIRDSQCGFKCFRRDVAHHLFGLQQLYRFSFDAEILYLAQRFNYSVCEKAVEWENSPQSRVNILNDPLNMFLDLIRIRVKHSRD